MYCLIRACRWVVSEKLIKICGKIMRQVCMFPNMYITKCHIIWCCLFQNTAWKIDENYNISIAEDSILGFTQPGEKKTYFGLVCAGLRWFALVRVIQYIPPLCCLAKAESIRSTCCYSQICKSIIFVHSYTIAYLQSNKGYLCTFVYLCTYIVHS